MIIEVKGVGTINKGAQLMLLSIIDHFKEKDVLLVSKSGSSFPKSDALNLGVKHLLRTKRKGIELHPFYKAIPFAIRKKLNLYLIDDVDVILDASGFVYGDQWNANFIKGHLSNSIEKNKKDGKKIILLPQAFGPFKKPEIKEEVGKVIHHADLIFVRDEISLQYVEENFGKKDSIQLAPDFTCLINKEHLIQKDEDRVLIIPNYKLIDQTIMPKEDVIKFFSDIILLVRTFRKTPVFLIHEGKRDEKMAHTINETLTNKLDIIIEPNPLMQKEIIASAFAVITGRFHGLVSSLSQGIPSLGLTWSHKYRMLLKDYGQEACLLEINDSDLETKVLSVLDPAKNKLIQRELRSRAEIQKESGKAMWEKVDDLIFN
jgi:colanic acid/amylovoran biosynthesis protein